MTIEVISKNKFFKEINYSPYPKQQQYHDSDARFKVMVAGRRAGKALAVNTPILTTSGWKTMEELEVGDSVFDDSGQPTEIVAATDIMYGRPCYEVKFSDGNTIIADAEHLWLTWDKNARKSLNPNETQRIGKPDVVSTSHIASTLYYGKNKPELNHAVMVCRPIQYEEQKLSIDPYVLGVWLGDGHSSCGRITCFTEDILFEVESRGYLASKNKHPGNYGILGLHVQLRESGLLNNKHIPAEYLRGSVSQRKDLLRGILDTDGTVDKSAADLTMMNERIIDGVEELATSLGCKVTRKTRRAKLYDKDCGLAHRLRIVGDFPLFNVDYKAVKQFAKISVGNKIRTIKAVNPIDTVPVKCIQVDNERGMYLAGKHCIPTHNSTMAARDLEPELFQPNRRYWVVAPTYELGEREFRVIWDDLIIGQQLGKNKQVKKAYTKNQGNMWIEFPWQTRVEVKSASHPEALVGEGLHGVIMSEAAKHVEDTWERYIRPSLADYRGWATFPSTPEGQNWLYKLWQYGRNPDSLYSDYESWQFPSWENRILYPGGREDPEIKQIELTTSPEWFAQEIGADFTAFTGRIYHEFGEITHVKNIEYNPMWTNVMVWDWGFVHPLACLEFQIDPWDNIYVWREHYGSYKTLEEHIAIVKTRANPQYYKIDMCFGDAADPGSAMTVTQHLTPCWTDPASKSGKGETGDTVWREGVELVKKFLKSYETGETDEYGTPVTVPKLFVDHSCVNTIREFNNYKAREPPRNARNKSVGRDAAQDFDNDCLDCIRYGLYHVYKLGAQHRLGDAMPALTGNYSGSNTIFKASDFEF